MRYAYGRYMCRYVKMIKYDIAKYYSKITRVIKSIVLLFITCLFKYCIIDMFDMHVIKKKKNGVIIIINKTYYELDL